MSPQACRLAAFAVVSAQVQYFAAALVPGPWSDSSKDAMERARLLTAALTLDEKLGFLHGSHVGGECDDHQECAYVGDIVGVPRLDVPPTTMNDGPQGFRDDTHKGTSTSFPSGLTMAASWDESAVFLWGKSMGKEFFEKGSNVQLGPGLCLARVPRNGRNFEYLSGEDPYLGYRLSQPAVKGIQSQKIVANAKHWVLNNQETNRQTVSEVADERTRFEMYYPPFEGAIEAGVGSVMCSYNKINGAWSCENPVTLKGDLKGKLGFKGYVMSDWGATHSMSIMAGLDNEEPNFDYMKPELLKPALAAGNVTEAAVDDSVTRILWSMFVTGVMDLPTSTWNFTNLTKNVSSEASNKAARYLSSMSTVLLKNDNATLPLPANTNKRLVILGEADASALIGGGGSGSVEPSYKPLILDSIKAKAGAKAQVDFNDGKDLKAATDLAKGADYTLVFVSCYSQEGSDRENLSLSHADLIEAVANVSRRTIVVAAAVGAVVMPWSKDVDSILTNFMPGQQAGPAIADVLFGVVNPSAKLPLTFPNVENETQLSPAQWPGLSGQDGTSASYSEKLLVGYRYYDAHKIKFDTGFPFGHGLSYTTFSYTNLVIRPCITKPFTGVNVTFEVRNSGTVPGAEVAQLYLQFPPSAGEPPLQLKGFQKTRILQPNECTKVEIFLRPRELSVYEVGKGWTVVPGPFGIAIGSSSRDWRLDADFEVLSGVVDDDDSNTLKGMEEVETVVV